MAPLIPRSFRRTYLRPRPLLLTLTLLLLLDAFFISTSLPPPTRSIPSQTPQNTEKIFIASIHRNTEYALRVFWNEALLKLVNYLGAENVYVSIIESGSQDDTKGALRDLQDELGKLGVGSTIDLGMDVYGQAEELANAPGEDEDRSGWIFTGRSKSGWELRRIPYLARLRNMAMEPLAGLSPGRKFGKVLWINDVVFTTEDVVTLLNTRDGSYAAACSLDFSKPTQPQIYYDTFALRDSDGYKTASLTWPFFYSSSSRNAIRANAPVPVKSCWNGMIVFDATPFYSSPELKFRGVEDTLAKEHVEGSECCLIHADNYALREEKGVWLNPNVKVSYNQTTYGIVNPGVGGQWPGIWEMVKGIWANRRSRWMGWVRLWSEARVVKQRVKKWTAKGKIGGEERVETGVECLVNEMQVLFENGWQHV